MDRPRCSSMCVAHYPDIPEFLLLFLNMHLAFVPVTEASDLLLNLHPQIL